MLDTAHQSTNSLVVSRSAHANRLNQFMRLTDCEIDFLALLERSDRQVTKGTHLVNIGGNADKIFIVKSGWAVLKSYTKQRGNQILRIYLPGEIIGFAEFGSARATHQITMQTDGVISEHNRKDFHQRMSDHPRLAALLLAVSSLDLNALRNHVTHLSAMDAKSNLKLFLLQLRSRLHGKKIGEGDRFEVPFSQVEIGQCVGLTSIYVNKLLRQFVAQGELEIERPYFKLHSRQEWESDTDFVDAFADLDTSWFPLARSEPVLTPSKNFMLKSSATRTSDRSFGRL